MVTTLEKRPKFPFPIVVKHLEEKTKEQYELESQDFHRKRILKWDTKALIELLRSIRYHGNYEIEYLENDIIAELAKRPHQRNKKERKEFVQKQQKRTERKTRGAR